MLTREEEYIIISILHNIHGYPFTQKGVDSLGFHTDEAGVLFRKILDARKSEDQDLKAYDVDLLDIHDRKIILGSFQLFLSEIDDYEIVSLTDHAKLELKVLYEKLQKMWMEDNK